MLVAKAKKDGLSLPRDEVWSFFTGAMGLDLGLEQAGVHVTLASEINPAYCRTIQLNRPDLDLIEGDVATLTGDSLRQHRAFDGEVHLMVGGPPCQPFSSGGRRAALSDPRGNLIYEFIRLVAEVRPRYFLLENVANLTTATLRHRPISERPGKHWNLRRYELQNNAMDGALALEPDEMAGSALKQVMLDISALGYHVTFAVVDAAEYGAPQHRLRFVMIGSRDHPPPVLPAPTHGPGRLPFVTVRQTIQHLLPAPGAHSEYTPSVRRFFDLVPPGGNWRSLPKELQAAALGGAFQAGGGKTGFFRRLSWDAPSPTITGRANRKGSAMCHPAESRPLSVPECAALQGFPEDWTFHGAMNTQYMQVGNAVPVHMGLAIGAVIVAHASAVSSRTVPTCGRVDLDVMMSTAIARLRAAGRNKKSMQKAA
jgi:DNA (cytosine-5)-methyltransferase 1